MDLRSWTRSLHTGWPHMSPKGCSTLRSVWGYVVHRELLWTSRFLNHFPSERDPVSSFLFTQTENASKCQEPITRIRWSGDWTGTKTGCKPYLTSMCLKLQWLSFRTWINGLFLSCARPQKSCVYEGLHLSKNLLRSQFLGDMESPLFTDSDMCGSSPSSLRGKTDSFILGATLWI